MSPESLGPPWEGPWGPGQASPAPAGVTILTGTCSERSNLQDLGAHQGPRTSAGRRAARRPLGWSAGWNSLAGDHGDVKRGGGTWEVRENDIGGGRSLDFCKHPAAAILFFVSVAGSVLLCW